MLNVIIVENNSYQAEYLKKIVNQRIMINPTPNSYDMQVALQSCEPADVISRVKHAAYLAILDIELGNDLNGIDVAEAIRKKAEFAEIIFVTAYKEYLPYTVSRRVEPFDYILKGNDISSIVDRLRRDIDEAYSRYQFFLNTPQRQAVKFIYEPVKGVKRQINLSDLYYIESVKYKSRRLRIVGKNVRVEYPGTLNKVGCKQLLGVNQSTLVNPQNILEFDRKNRLLYFTEDKKIKCSVSYRKIKAIVNVLKNNS